MAELLLYALLFTEKYYGLSHVSPAPGANIFGKIVLQPNECNMTFWFNTVCCRLEGTRCI